MGTFGERLQREREMRGITLEEIADATKIGTRSLRALEQQEFEKLPGGIFNKGFVRAYSKYLGIDEEQAVADYLVAVGEAQVAARDTRKVEPPLPDIENRIALVEEPAPGPAIPWKTLAGVAAVVVIVAAGWFVYSQRKFDFASLWRSTPVVAAKPAVTPAPPAPSPQATAPVAAVAANPTTDPPNNATPDPGSLVLHVRATQNSWVTVTADGRLVMNAMLNASEEKDFRARERMTLKTGNAGGVEVSFNGQPFAPVGESREVRTLIFTAAGIQQQN